MTTLTKRSINDQLNYAQLVINNSRTDPRIQELVAVYGYPAETLAEGQRLINTARQTMELQAATAGAAYLATEQAKKTEQAARASYQRIVQVVRAVYPGNSPQLKALGVKGAEPVRATAFIETATTVFNNAIRIREMSAMLAKHGYTPYKLALERGTIHNYQEALQAQALAKAQAKAATASQQTAMAEMRRWLAQYIKIARVALSGQPQLLRAFNIPGETAMPKLLEPEASLTLVE